MSSTTNNWSEDKIKLLLKWRQHSRVYHWLHAKSSSHKHWLYTLLFYTATGLTALGLGQNFSNFFTEGTDAFISFQIANAIIITLIGIINIYLKTSKISELAEKHSNTSKDFYILQNEIEEQLAQTPEDRDNGKIYLKKIRVKITSLTKDSPEIPPNIWKKFSKAVENGEIFNESDPVTVYTKAEYIAQTESKVEDASIISLKSESEEKSVSSPKDSHEDITIDETDFTNKIVKSGKLKPNILKALDYQMARFN
jgi:hypothetical protein